MKLEQYTYLLSIMVFVGTPLLVKWKRAKKELKRYEIILLILVLLSILFTTTDYFALKWGAWHYNPERTFNKQVATEIETYIFAAAVCFIVASATLTFAVYEDRIRRKKVITKRGNKRPK
ncbi:lycopene cyclase domain-containing protein [Candidatus Saccharibacteria bacterium]|nr:lycopene cyclase domain-containing protein [Candidatus Saccharibacteria bacterium]